MRRGASASRCARSARQALEVVKSGMRVGEF
jgi:hypothetical protein